jgi:hypothetical protein
VSAGPVHAFVLDYFNVLLYLSISTKVFHVVYFFYTVTLQNDVNALKSVVVNGERRRAVRRYRRR